MAIKDFFRSSQVIASSSLDSMNRDIESAEYIAPFVEDQERLLPHVDFGEILPNMVLLKNIMISQ
jgi:hypothetical protein